MPEHVRHDGTGVGGAAMSNTAMSETATVTILATEGSAPRGAGTVMTVTHDDSTGTIGGGQLEYRAIEQARRLLAEMPSGWLVQDYPLGPLLGQCCGGRVRLLIERGRAADGAVLRFADDRVIREEGDAPVPAARGERPRPGDRLACPADIARVPVLLFGAGHVGRAVARALEGLPFLLQWYDVRPGLAALPGVVTISEQEMPLCLGAAPADAAVLVMTHDHGLDYRLIGAALAAAPRYVGLIGSATKRTRFTTRLIADGIATDRLTCPIGIAGIVGKAPAVIAASVAAQLLIACAT